MKKVLLGLVVVAGLATQGTVVGMNAKAATEDLCLKANTLLFSKLGSGFHQSRTLRHSFGASSENDARLVLESKKVKLTLKFPLFHPTYKKQILSSFECLAKGEDCKMGSWTVCYLYPVYMNPDNGRSYKSHSLKVKIDPYMIFSEKEDKPLKSADSFNVSWETF